MPQAATKRSPTRKADAEKYRHRKEREAARQRKQTEAGQDIAPIPKVKRQAMREKCTASLRVFCETCFPLKFRKAWSQDHHTAIAKMERAIRDGDLFALAMPRGAGKTTLVMAAVLWAILCGHRSYVALIGPTKKHAAKLLATVKVELETNDHLYEMWPEACHAVRALERIANRARGQRHNGDHTYIEWGKELIVLASIPNAKCSGAIVEAVGITGSVRGMQQASPEGHTRRPDLAVIDDPQTKKSAKSQTQVEMRLEVIQGDVLGLAGPGERFAAFCMCTVVEKDDVADQLLDRKRNPAWQGDRFQMVYSWPTNMDKWDRYSTILCEDLAGGNGPERATKFYKSNRREMDVGFKVAWDQRYDEKTEISAQQHAWNLQLRDPKAFAAEFQNTPATEADDADLLSIEEIERKQSGYTRSVVPPEADTLTSFVDVQGELLYWIVVAWRLADFSGWVLDYGSWPDQGIPYFTLGGIRKTLARAYPKTGKEARVRAGLTDLLADLGGRTYKALDGREERISRIGVDATWGEMTKVVQATCRESAAAALTLPQFGRSITASQKPMEEWAPQTGERRGYKWLIRPTKNTHGRHVLTDVNAWKSFVHARLSTAIGDPGSLCLFKPRLRTEHRMIAEHWRAEKRERIRGEQRELDQFTLPPHKPDNHLWDCIVGAAVQASIAGATLSAHRPTKPRMQRRATRTRVSYMQ